MNITLALQELDDLIVQHTQPPVTAILRNKLHPLREQIEAYVGQEEQRANLADQMKAEHEKLQLAQAKPTPNAPADEFAYRRGLYYNAGDGVPFCTHCWETANRKIHLSGPIPMMDKTTERWECHTCDNNYTAKPPENFLISPGRRRRHRN